MKPTPLTSTVCRDSWPEIMQRSAEVEFQKYLGTTTTSSVNNSNNIINNNKTKHTHNCQKSLSITVIVNRQDTSLEHIHVLTAPPNGFYIE